MKNSAICTSIFLSLGWSGSLALAEWQENRGYASTASLSPARLISGSNKRANIDGQGDSTEAISYPISAVPGVKVEDVLESNYPTSYVALTTTARRAQRNRSAFEQAALCLLLLPVVALLTRQLALYAKETRAKEMAIGAANASDDGGYDIIRKRDLAYSILTFLVSFVAALLISNFIYRGARVAFSGPWGPLFQGRKRNYNMQFIPGAEQQAAATKQASQPAETTRDGLTADLPTPLT